MHALPLFLMLLFSLSTFTNGLAIDFDLVHRDSPLSPFYNSPSTLPELTRNDRWRSRVRSGRLLLQTNILPPVLDQASDLEYLVRIYIGSPPVEAWAMVDTGSDLIWVQCLPCDMCYNQTGPIFSPFKSSTYQIMSCHSKPCTFFPKGQYGCGRSTQCEYVYSYGNNDTTYGDLGRDLFSFRGKSASSHWSPLLFGCGHNNTGVYSSKGSGLMGLGTGPLSLVSQLGAEIDYKFSYCLVPYFSNSTGKLKLGKEAQKSGSHGAVSTPFTTGGVVNTNYALTLEGVSVGNKRVETDHKIEGNTLIDSGATWFLMESSFYRKIEALIKEAVGIEEAKNTSISTLCYSNKYAESIMKNFPDFVVHFKGADVYLKPEDNIFIIVEDFICLSIFPFDGFAGFDFDYGNIPQVNFQVEYDLQANQISFAPADCSKV